MGATGDEMDVTGVGWQPANTGAGVDWSGVRERVTALRESPFTEKVFGARQQGFGHDFVLQPPLSEADLAEAEEELGVALPTDYRNFLVEVGAGGAGPFYGLFPLRCDGQGWHWLDDTVRSDNSLLWRPFPAADQRARWSADLDAREPVSDDFPDEQSYLAAYRVWSEEWERLHDEMTAGAIRLSHEGCGYYTWLVVTGPEHGTLWTDLRACDGPIEPLAGTGRDRVSFGEWYLGWLAQADREAHGR
ncbi:SMI1/KNR4 family protein [Kitasatospora sp. NPDC048540]|uniref:SMI1/KNR4 family protein n=1 Tax=Kitasatospora sp. NPDC048540 TaxID=3155634 RepID=UPI0033F96B4F